jgi:hypothetical protein
VLGVVSYLTGLAYGLGPAVGGAGYLLLWWSMAVLIGEAHGGDPPATAAALLVGGLAAMVVIGVATAARTRWGKAHPTSDDNAPAPSEHRAAQSSDAPLVNYPRGLTLPALQWGVRTMAASYGLGQSPSSLA